ncbi:hypothetical protein LJC60_08505, partial [Ruminococcaceae bacterium OttesenSCG-928-D13]|nr:hypothetical protein [Ruminococcaceae bacterium OttesenSCG-928-D13]
MAEKDAKDKKPKRPRHTQLVVPGSGKKKGRYKPVEKDRLGRSTPAEATRPVAEGAETGAPKPAA